MENKDKYEKIIVEIEDYAILLLDEAGNVIDWNKGAEKLKGYLTEEIIGKNFRVFYTAEDCKNNRPEKLIETATREGKANDEGWRVRKDGSLFWGSILITALHNEENKLTGFLKITRDLSERKRMEEELILANKDLEAKVKERAEKLAATEQEYRQTLDNMLEGVQMHDFNWKYLYVNDALVKYSTYQREELLGFTLQEKYPGIEHSDLFKTLDRCMTDRVPEKIETEFVFPNGTIAVFELSIQPIPQGIFILSVNKTEQKKAKEKLLKANRLYEFLSSINKSIVRIKEQNHLLENACTIAIEIGHYKIAYVALLDEKGVLNIVHLHGDKAAAEKFMKLSGFDCLDPLHKDIPTVRVMNSGQYSVNNDMQNDPALSHWKDEFTRQGIHASIALPIIKFGKIAGIFGLHSGVKDIFDEKEISLLEEATGDISFALENFDKEKKHIATQELAHKNERRFQALIEKSVDMKTLTNIEGEFVYASPSVSKVFEYSQEEFFKKQVSNFYHPDDIPDLIKNRAKILQTPGKSFDFQYRLLHKKGRWIWCEGTLTNLLQEPGINALVSNFRDISEKKNAEQLQKFNQNNLDALINNTNDLLWSVDKNFKLITFNQPFSRSVNLFTGRELNKGDEVFLSVVSQEQYERFKAYYSRALGGEIFTETEHITEPIETWSEISFYPIYNEEEVIGTACHSRDITERKKNEFEREQMIADIIQQNKNFEQFTYIVSHNLRAPVANILGISNILKSELSEEDRIKTQQFLFKAVEHLDEMVKDLNKILQVRTEIAELKEMISFPVLLDDLKLSIHHQLENQDVHITADFSAIDKVITLKSYMQSIFYNMVSNSLKFRKTGMPLIISIRSEIVGNKVKLSFKDNGRGLDLDQHKGKVFGLYNRFHLNVEGKGIGLFMVKTQLEVLGGSIHLNSIPGSGAEFIMEFPLK